MPFIGLAVAQALIIAFPTVHRRHEVEPVEHRRLDLRLGRWWSDDRRYGRGRPSSRRGHRRQRRSGRQCERHLGRRRGGASSATGKGGTTAAGKVGGVQTASGVVTGDISHCKGDKQIDMFANGNPPCAAKFREQRDAATRA